MGRIIDSIWTLRTMKSNLETNGDMLSIRKLRDGGLPDEADKTYRNYLQAIDDAIDALTTRLKQLQ